MHTNIVKQVALILVAAILVLVGLGFVLPALAKLRLLNYLPGPDIGLLLLGLLLMLAGPVVALFSVRKRAA